MKKVYIANFGEGNVLWPVAHASSTVLTIDNIEAHPFWQAGDRNRYVETAMNHLFTARGLSPTLQTAGRWYNLIDELRDTEDDLWITRQGSSLWWTVSLVGELTETVTDSTNPDRDGPNVWLIQKPCQPWSNRDLEGRALLWEALHPKARDFLSTEATFQTIRNDRGYADYARALIAGESLDHWEKTALYREKAAEAKKQGVRLYTAKEKAAYRMARTIMETVSGANGQIVEKRVKEKNTSLNAVEWEKLLREKMGEQQDSCALTGLPIGYDSECDDKQMLASLDRIDSKGHYTPENV